MPQETKVQPELAPASAPRATLQGVRIARDDEPALLAAMEQAFDYRGDVTLTLDGGRVVTGYIFDRRGSNTLRGGSVRLLMAGSDQPVSVPYDAIASVEFSGKDAAQGKTFENWVKRYIEKKIKGEAAGIDCESLDDPGVRA